MEDEYLGKYIDVFSVKPLKEGFGATTAYIAYALDKNEIDGAIVVKADENWEPKAIVARNSDDLRASIGTKWVITPMVDAIIDALKVERLERVAIIGTPCQCRVIRDIKEYPMQLGDVINRIKLVIGLFCMGSFTQDGFKTMVERKFGITLPEIKNAEIRSDKFIIRLINGKIIEESLENVKKDVKFACLFCDDFTARSADISFGNAGSESGWRSVIVRDEYAYSLLQSASRAGYLKMKKLNPEGVNEIIRLSKEKMERAKRNESLI